MMDRTLATTDFDDIEFFRSLEEQYQALERELVRRRRYGNSGPIGSITSAPPRTASPPRARASGSRNARPHVDSGVGLLPRSNYAPATGHGRGRAHGRRARSASAKRASAPAQPAPAPLHQPYRPPPAPAPAEPQGRAHAQGPALLAAIADAVGGSPDADWARSSVLQRLGTLPPGAARQAAHIPELLHAAMLLGAVEAAGSAPAERAASWAPALRAVAEVFGVDAVFIFVGGDSEGAAEALTLIASWLAGNRDVGPVGSVVTAIAHRAHVTRGPICIDARAPNPIFGGCALAVPLAGVVGEGGSPPGVLLLARWRGGALDARERPFAFPDDAESMAAILCSALRPAIARGLARGEGWAEQPLRSDGSEAGYSMYAGGAAAGAASPARPAHLPPPLPVGARVLANWRSGGTWHAGQIVASDARSRTYAVRYDDGDDEAGVEEERVRADPHAGVPRTPQHAPRHASSQLPTPPPHGARSARASDATEQQPQQQQQQQLLQQQLQQQQQQLQQLQQQQLHLATADALDSERRTRAGSERGGSRTPRADGSDAASADALRAVLARLESLETSARGERAEVATLAAETAEAGRRAAEEAARRADEATARIEAAARASLHAADERATGLQTALESALASALAEQRKLLEALDERVRSVEERSGEPAAGEAAGAAHAALAAEAQAQLARQAEQAQARLDAVAAQAQAKVDAVAAHALAEREARAAPSAQERAEPRAPPAAAHAGQPAAPQPVAPTQPEADAAREADAQAAQRDSLRELELMQADLRARTEALRLSREQQWHGGWAEGRATSAPRPLTHRPPVHPATSRHGETEAGGLFAELRAPGSETLAQMKARRARVARMLHTLEQLSSAPDPESALRLLTPTRAADGQPYAHAHVAGAANGHGQSGSHSQNGHGAAAPQPHAYPAHAPEAQWHPAQSPQLPPWQQ